MLGVLKIKKKYFADLGLLYSSIIWGTTFFIVKDTVNYIDPVTLCAYRFLLAALIFIPYLLLKGKPLFTNIKEGCLLGLFLWLIYISQTIGLKYTTASNAAFITGLFVAFIPFFLLIFFKTLPSVFQIIAVFIALLGLWFLTGGLKEFNIGDLITLVTAISYALHVLFADKFVKKKCDPYILCFQQFFFVGILSLIVSLLFHLPLSIKKQETIGVIFFLTIFPTISAFLIQLVAQKITPAIKVSLIFALEPVFGAIFAWTLGGESYTINQIIGGLLVFTAIAVHEIKPGFRLFQKPITDNL